ncbi:MAG: S1 family peptidase [Pseudobdellovibrionaceae bacterium]
MKYLLSLIFSFYAFASATINVPDESLKESLIVLDSDDGCGTGFVLSSGKIITNAHVIAQKCNQSLCPNVKISRASALGAAPVSIGLVDLQIIATFPKTDLAILKPTRNLNIKGISGKIRSPVDGEEIFTIGFSNCESLNVQMGNVSNSTASEFGLHFTIQKGQSGSPVFNKYFDIVGLVYQGNSFDLGKATRVDHLGNDFEAIDSQSGLIDLQNLYRSALDAINSPDPYKQITSLNQERDIPEVETQLALSGQCPALKDYWIWTHGGFPAHVPAPIIDAKALSMKCYEVFQQSVEYQTNKILLLRDYMDSFRDIDKLEALKTLSPMAYFAETQYYQSKNSMNLDSTVIGKLKKKVQTYGKLASGFTGVLCIFFALFFIFKFLFSRFRTFRRFFVGTFILCAICTLSLLMLLI